jgi:hypothetical protein
MGKGVPILYEQRLCSFDKVSSHPLVLGDVVTCRLESSLSFHELGIYQQFKYSKKNRKKNLGSNFFYI